MWQDYELSADDVKELFNRRGGDGGLSYPVAEPGKGAPRPPPPPLESRSKTKQVRKRGDPPFPRAQVVEPKQVAPKHRGTVITESKLKVALIQKKRRAQFVFSEAPR